MHGKKPQHKITTILNLRKHIFIVPLLMVLYNCVAHLNCFEWHLIACEEQSRKCDLMYRCLIALIAAGYFLASHILPDIVGISHRVHTLTMYLYWHSVLKNCGVDESNWIIRLWSATLVLQSSISYLVVPRPFCITRYCDDIYWPESCVCRARGVWLLNEWSWIFSM